MGTIDAPLQRQLYLWRRNPAAAMEVPAEGGRPKVLVRFSGDLADLESAGMHVETVVGDIAVGHIDIRDVERLSQLEQVSRIEVAHRTKPLIHNSVPAIHADVVRTGPLMLTGTGVVIGIVDSGIDVFHHAFRNADGTTRLLSLWDQQLTQQPGDSPPAGFNFTAGTGGVEFKYPAINAALTSGSTFRSADTSGHGTHVAGIAAGNGSQAGNCHLSDYYIGVAPEADLVVVKVADDTNSLVNAAQYVFAVASAAGKAAVVNFSLGAETHYGPHDGTSLFESGLDALLSGPGAAIVACAGNDGDSGTHAHATVAASDSRTFSFQMPAQDVETEFFDVWYKGGGALKLTLTAPSGVAYGTVSQGDPQQQLAFGAAGGDVVNAGTSTVGDWSSFSLDISPPNGGTITTGTWGQHWTITLQEVAGTAVDVDIWFQDFAADSGPPSFVGADQDPTRTINVPGTANNVICVGSYDYRNNTLSSFSSRGPRVDGVRKPDVCAPGLAIFSARSDKRGHWYCCDCCLDFFIHQDGTSISTPHVTGVAALMLEQDKSLTFDKVREYIVVSAQAPDPVTAPTLPNNDWGGGIVDALSACNLNAPAAAPAAAQSAGGGPGGGMEQDEAFPLSPSAYTSAADRLRMLERRFSGFQLWHDLAGMVSLHYVEVARLTNENMKVAAMWHRLGGPRLLIRLLASASEDMILPESFEGRPLGPAIDRWLTMLDRYGSPRLQADIAMHRPLLMSLPGAAVTTFAPAAG
jgi:subtilisin family serine protease